MINLEMTKEKRKKREKKPKHSVLSRAYVFPLSPSLIMVKKLFVLKDLCCELRNLLVVEREENRRVNSLLRNRTPAVEVHYVSRSDQYISVAKIMKSDLRFKGLHSQVAQNVAVRVDEGTKRWLETFKSGRKQVSPPHVIESKEYKSFTYPQYGSSVKIKSGKIHLSKVGNIEINDYRKMLGKPKSVTIKFDAGKWWAVVSCELQANQVYRNKSLVENLYDIGGDPGLTSLLTMSDGLVFDPPKAMKAGFSKLKHEQKKMSRQFEMRKKLHKLENERLKTLGLPLLVELKEIPYSNRLKSQIKKVAKIHTKVGNIREYHHFKIASVLESKYRCVAIEEHGVKFMFKNRKIAKSAAERGISSLKIKIKSKLGLRYVGTSNSRKGIGGNSQTCVCGASVPKDLSVRVHQCESCGLNAGRDLVSANIVELIAFGTTHLKVLNKGSESCMESGHDFNIRGENKGRKGNLTTESVKASEFSVKRKSLVSKLEKQIVSRETCHDGRECLVLGQQKLADSLLTETVNLIGL